MSGAIEVGDRRLNTGQLAVLEPHAEPVVAAREASIWFGAWIGARGRKMKRLNAEAITGYETALAEVQAKQP